MTPIFLLIDTGDIIIAVVSVILGGGLFTAYATFKKASPEISRINIEIAGEAVIVQKGVIEDLRTDILRLKENIREVEAESKFLEKENEECKKTLTRLEKLLREHNIRIEYIEHKGGT
jgi:predicted RNase H-like nuclease (RuvC/YqgF family)